MPLSIHVAADYQQMSLQAARLLIRRLYEKPNLLLCASAGGTPTGLYRILAGRHQRQPNLFRKMRVITVDEWGGLPAGHPATCKEDLAAKLLRPCAIEQGHVAAFYSATSAPEKECARMSRWLERHGPIDVCILGLGLNGHIAMLEPADELPLRAHVARLAPSSLKHPMLAGSGRRPRFGLSLGLGDVMSSAEVLLLVSGAQKHPVLDRLRRESITTHLPASLLRLHPNAHLFCDKPALGQAS